MTPPPAARLVARVAARLPSWRFLALRLSEAGTWRAIGVALLAVGIQIPDAAWQHATLAGTTIAALVGVFLPELGSPVAVAGTARDAMSGTARDAMSGTAADAPPPPARPAIPVSLAGEA